MTRQLRIEYPGAFYHIVARGHRGEPVFYEDVDRDEFLGRLYETKQKYNLLIHVFVMMDDHYHLMLKTPEGNLSKAMHYFNASYANWFKGKHRLVGSVFQGRYRSILVEKGTHLLTLTAYLHLDPLRAGIVKKPEKYRWSSFRYYCNGKASGLLCTDVIDTHFPSRKEYRKFVYGFAGNGVTKKDLYGTHSILGSNLFKKKVLVKLREGVLERGVREYSDLKNLQMVSKDTIMAIIITTFGVSEEEVLKRRRGNVYRKLLIYGLKRYSSLRLKDIGELLDIDYTGVSESYRRFMTEVIVNKEVSKKIVKFEKALESEQLQPSAYNLISAVNSN